MIKELVDSQHMLDITLLFSNHRNAFPFWTELEAWQHTYPSFKTAFVVTSEEGRLTRKRLQEYLERNGIERLTPQYSIAGSPQMVHSCEQHLFDLGVEKNSMKTDSFEGYESSLDGAATHASRAVSASNARGWICHSSGARREA
jgi:ferredoxin-NADP reductase